MIYKRELKNVRFSYDTVSKTFNIVKNNNTIGVMVLGKAEAGSFTRFWISMTQYHSHVKKEKKIEIEPIEKQVEQESLL